METIFKEEEEAGGGKMKGVMPEPQYTTPSTNFNGESSRRTTGRRIKTEEEASVSDPTTPDLERDDVSQHQLPNIQFPITLTFKDVVYKIMKTDQNTRPILNGITGFVTPGEMLAILGHSTSSGKTTLLNALGGRLGTALSSGDIKYNSESLCGYVKRRVGFVTQKDILQPHHTVQETLTFTALLRLPNSMSKMEKVYRVEYVIEELGLHGCRNKVIGSDDSLLSGISRGERRRVSIGQEMLTNPSLLLLDEPTSGFDSTRAHMVISALANFATGGGTVVASIQHPSTRIFYKFDKILLLSEGSPLYFGNSSDVLSHFESIGHTPFDGAVHMDPADFLLEIAHGDVEDVVGAYRDALEPSILVHIERENEERTLSNNINKGSMISWWGEFVVLFRRALKVRRQESFSLIRITQVLVAALLCGLL